MIKKLQALFILPTMILLLSGGFNLTQAALSPVTDEWMVEHSDIIVMGKVVSITSDFADDGLIWSSVTLNETSNLMGYSGDEIVFRYQGGTADGITLKVDVSPVFEEGEDVIVFLKNRNGSLEVTNWYLSKCTITDGVIKEKNIGLQEYIEGLEEIIDNQ